MIKKDLSILGKDVVTDITSTTPPQIFSYMSPTYLAITNDGDMEDSELPYILKYADIAVILIPFRYTVITQEDISQYVIFIDKRGIPNNKIKRNGWTLAFDTPITSGYRTYHRYAIIENGKYKMSMTVDPTITLDNFQKVWKIFIQLSENTNESKLRELEKQYCDSIGRTVFVSSINVKSI